MTAIPVVHSEYPLDALTEDCGLRLHAARPMAADAATDKTVVDRRAFMGIG